MTDIKPAPVNWPEEIEWRQKSSEKYKDDPDEPMAKWPLVDYDRHALAALALHGQTFGFTREDVEALRSLSADLHPNNEPFYSLADRIAALLPPEE